MIPLKLPPPYTEIPLPAGLDVFARARAVAAASGAGTLVWAASDARLDIAVVLEPNEALASARLVMFAGLNALGDALSVAAPPEKPLAFVLPDQVHFDLGLVGGVRLAWAECEDDSVPDWLVLGCTLRVNAQGEPPPASLVGEGFEAFEPRGFIEMFARHLLALLDDWRVGGLPTQLTRLRQRGLPDDALLHVPAQPSWMDDYGRIRP